MTYYNDKNQLLATNLISATQWREDHEISLKQWGKITDIIRSNPDHVKATGRISLYVTRTPSQRTAEKTTVFYLIEGINKWYREMLQQNPIIFTQRSRKGAFDMWKFHETKALHYKKRYEDQKERGITDRELILIEIVDQLKEEIKHLTPKE